MEKKVFDYGDRIHGIWMKNIQQVNSQTNRSDGKNVLLRASVKVLE